MFNVRLIPFPSMDNGTLQCIYAFPGNLQNRTYPQIRNAESGNDENIFTLKTFRPFPSTMIYGQNFDTILIYPIRQNIRTCAHYQFARTVDSTWSAKLGIILQKTDALADFRLQGLSGIRVILGDIQIDVPQIPASGFSPYDFHTRLSCRLICSCISASISAITCSCGITWP